MLTEVTVQVAIVITEVGPLKLAHRKLRSEPERAFSDVLLWNEPLERLASNDEADFVRRGHPSRVATLCEAVGHRSGDDWVDEDEVAIFVEPGCTQWLLVDAKREATISLKLIAADAGFTQLEAASREVQQVFLDVSVVADRLNRVSRKHDLKELSVLGSKRFGQHLLAEEGSDPIQRAEVERGIRFNLGKLRVDCLHIASEVVSERLGAIADVLDAGLNQELIANVGVDDLENGFLQRHLRLKVATPECSPSLLDADPRASTAQGLKLKAVLGAANLIGAGTSAAQTSVVLEQRSGERAVAGHASVGRHSHFLDDRAHHVGDVGKRAAVDGVDVGRFPGKHLGDLPDDAVHVLGREVLNCCKRETISGHNDLSGFPRSPLPTRDAEHQGCAASKTMDTTRKFGFSAPGTLELISA